MSSNLKSRRMPGQMAKATAQGICVPIAMVAQGRMVGRRHIVGKPAGNRGPAEVPDL